MYNLPEEYVPLESLPLPGIQWFILPGFKSMESAIGKIQFLIDKTGYTQYEIRTDEKAFSIVLPDLAVPLLNEEERKKLVRFHRILSTVNHPTVWRFLKKPRVEKFFETGELRISTYSSFAENDSLIRRDDDEGRITLQGCEGDLKVEMGIGTGDNALVLCTSLSQNNIFSDGTVYDACIEIFDIQSFVQVITKKLAEKVNITGVVHGACMYHNKELYNKSRGTLISKVVEASPDKGLDFSLLSHLAAELGGNKVFFSKPLEKREECEYRIVWLTDEEQREPFEIEVPEARDYCRAVWF